MCILRNHVKGYQREWIHRAGRQHSCCSNRTNFGNVIFDIGRYVADHGLVYNYRCKKNQKLESRMRSCHIILLIFSSLISAIDWSDSDKVRWSNKNWMLWVQSFKIRLPFSLDHRVYVLVHVERLCYLPTRLHEHHAWYFFTNVWWLCTDNIMLCWNYMSFIEWMATARACTNTSFFARRSVTQKSPWTDNCASDSAICINL